MFVFQCHSFTVRSLTNGDTLRVYLSLQIIDQSEKNELICSRDECPATDPVTNFRELNPFSVRLQFRLSLKVPRSVIPASSSSEAEVREVSFRSDASL